MAQTGRSVAVTRKTAASRLVTLFALIMFAFQGYLLQTHIDGFKAVAQVAAQNATSSSVPKPADPYNPATCPLCQEILHAGTYVAPAAASLPLQLDWIVFLVSPVVRAPVAAEPRIDWQSRAPP